MWNTFKAEVKHIFKSRWRVLAWVMALFIPFTYGFLYLNAYWAPFSKTEKLDIAVINRDSSDENSVSGKLVKQLTNENGVRVSDQHYKIYEDTSNVETARQSVQDGDHSAVIVIPKGYSELMEQFAQKLLFDIHNGTLNFEELEKMMADEIYKRDGQFKKVTFYNSYKNNYLEGEMTNFLAASSDLIFKNLLANIDWDQIIQMGVSAAASSLSSLSPDERTQLKTTALNIFKLMGSRKDSNPIILETTTKGRVNTYGFGLSPYFMSIGLFAGALILAFIIKNERHIKSEGTVKHYFGKWLIWVMSGAIQNVILVTAMTLQGVKIGEDQWMLYIWGFFMSMIFCTIVHAIMFSIRYGDIAEFTVVIILILQLISSSGTFPVEMQAKIFQVIHPVVPFTYTIEAIREMFWDPSYQIILKDFGILLLFPIVLVPLSILLNHRFDKKTVTLDQGMIKYKSYEIHLGDF